MGSLTDLFDAAQGWLFEHAVQPLMFTLGLGNLLSDGFRATAWLMVGVLQIAVMLAVLRTLERWRPLEPVTDRAAVRTDIVYTLIHRLGLVRLVLFFSIDPLWDWARGQASLHGVMGLELDHLWPGLTDRPLVSFCLYLLLFDFVDYGYHRIQHGLNWWWQLHAVHHSQRQMTMWTDNRNHLLDDLLRDGVFVLLAFAVGVPPGQFIALVAVTQLVESLSHANVRLGFGPVLGRLIVGPDYHRRHHAIGLGHESAGAGTLGGCNFAVLFPVWDIVFGTARFDAPLQPTGIRDQLEGRDYGHGFWAQQWLGLRRLVGRG
ncbi:sterol desaturase family protein [Ideonella sp. DXS22W]|uniref:Sterol desaturase family protein n=1 Tax=Pseudaquabacterium inlustre TaxID=2984192 RepID=A0ABU9CG40_9BURK